MFRIRGTTHYTTGIDQQNKIKSFVDRRQRPPLSLHSNDERDVINGKSNLSSQQNRNICKASNKVKNQNTQVLNFREVE